MGHQQSAMIHGWIRSVVVDGFPFAGVQIEVEGDRRWLGRLAVVADAVVIVRVIGTTGEIDFLIFLRTTSSDAVTRRARGLGQLGPFDSSPVVMVDLAHPAFIGGNVPG